MQENAIYSVISPEGCAAILWRDAAQAKKAAAAFKPDAAHCLELGVIDGIVPEPEGGAHADHDAAAALLRDALVAHLDELERRPRDELPARRGGRSSARWACSRASDRAAARGSPHFPQAYPRHRKPRSRAGISPELCRGGCDETGGRRSVSHDGRESTAGVSEPDGVPAQARSARGHARAVRRRSRRRGAPLLRRPAPRRAPAPLRPAARARRRARELGRARRASRSTAASGTSPCTSRTTRSTTRRSRA